MACGFGECVGCVVPRRGGGDYGAADVDGPVVDDAMLEHVEEQRGGGGSMTLDFCGLKLAHRSSSSGT